MCGTPIVEIDFYGFSGWTTEQLLRNAHDDHLSDFLGKSGPGIAVAVTKKPYDLVILMAGTNDLGHGESAETIFSNLQNLSKFAFECDTPAKCLLNIGIPDSAFINRDKSARARRDHVNQMLADRANSRLYYIPSPLTYTPTTRYYESDGLHFSEFGYQELANGISDTVHNLLIKE